MMLLWRKLHHEILPKPPQRLASEMSEIWPLAYGGGGPLCHGPLLRP